MLYNFLKKVFCLIDVKGESSINDGLNFYVDSDDTEKDDHENEIETRPRADSSWEITMFKTDELNSDRHRIADALFYSAVLIAKSYGIKRIIVQPTPYGRTPIRDDIDFGEMVYGKRGFKHITKEMMEEYEYLSLKGEVMYLDLDDISFYKLKIRNFFCTHAIMQVRS